MNQAPINLDEQIDEILFELTDSSGWDLNGITQSQYDELSEQLRRDRTEAHAKLTKLISLQESKARISEVHKFLNRSDSLGESKYATRRIDQLNSNLSKSGEA